jgi:predicted nucleic acid-binding protein
LCDEDRYVVDACVVIDFCGRTDNLPLLMQFLGASGVITSVVQEELERQRDKRYPVLDAFLVKVEEERVLVRDPDTSDKRAAAIIEKWSRVFDPGEVASAALAATNQWTLLTVDRAPAQQFVLSEGVGVMSTKDVLAALVRRGSINKVTAEKILADVKASSRRGRRR